MNKVQELFSSDGRVDGRKDWQKRVTSVIYCLFDWTQFRNVYRWIRTQSSNRNPWEDGLPWVTFDAIRFMDNVLDEKSKVFEYGSGGSTVYFSKKCSEVVSVEHDEDWYKIVSGALGSKKNYTYILKKPNQEKSLHDYYRSISLDGLSFKGYVEAINNYEDSYFDFISVDGRARVQCVREAYSKVKPGGYILLDNSERKDYYEAHLFLERSGAIPYHFFGLVGYEPPLAQTTIWKINK